MWIVLIIGLCLFLLSKNLARITQHDEPVVTEPDEEPDEPMVTEPEEPWTRYDYIAAFVVWSIIAAFGVYFIFSI